MMHINLKFRSLVCIASILMVTSCIPSQEAGPVVNGHPLGFWLKKLVDKSSTDSERAKAKQAVILCGTNALEFLTDKLSVKEHVEKVGHTQPAEIADAISIGGGAVAAFEILGNQAKPAIPRLIQLMSSGDSATVGNAARVLSGFGAEGAKAITVGLTNANRDARDTAARWLIETRTNLTEVLPQLISSLDRLDESAADECCYILANTRKDFTNLVPAFVEGILSTNASTRRVIVEALGWMGTNAAVARPSLEQLKNDPDDEVRKAADKALLQVEGKNLN